MFSVLDLLNDEIEYVFLCLNKIFNKKFIRLFMKKITFLCDICDIFQKFLGVTLSVTPSNRVIASRASIDCQERYGQICQDIWT